MRAIALLALLLAAPAQATLLFYPDRVIWEDNFTSVENEDFESIPLTGGAVSLIETPNFDVTADGDGLWIEDLGGSRVLSGTVLGATPTELPSYNLLTFDSPIYAFAFDLYPLFDNDFFYVSLDGDPFFGVEASFYQDPSVRFVGISTNDPFTTVDFFVDYDAYSVDNVAFVEWPFPVPEPATGLLVGLSMAALAMGRRRRLALRRLV